MKETFELLTLPSGFRSLRSIDQLETFHPGIGPAAEANQLHVQQQNLIARRQPMEGPLVIWDVGLGAAANALAVIETIQSSPLSFELHSFEISTDAMHFALENAEALGYLAPYSALVKRLLAAGEVEIRPGLIWKLHLGDFASTLKVLSLPAPHSILFDPYSPKRNPSVWSQETFAALFKRLDPSRPCLLTNYTRSTSARVTMLLAGFYVGIGTLIHEKEETTLAANDPALLARPLDRAWLEKRVKISRAAAPHRGGTYSLAPIASEDLDRLFAHPQFQV